jgi:AcrR family transcriptional regulator
VHSNPSIGPRGDPSAATAASAVVGVTGTKLEIVRAALKTLKIAGFHGASAREIARAGSFNQALIFYHFGSVRNLLLAALDVVSARRMEAYRPAFTNARTIPELASLAREIYRDDLEQGYVTVLGELVAGGMSDRELGRAVVARIEPWIEMVQRKLDELLAGSVFEAIVSPRDVAFAIVALYLGIDMLSHLDGDHAAAEALLELGIRYAPLAGAVLPSQQEGHWR